MDPVAPQVTPAVRTSAPSLPLSTAIQIRTACPNRDERDTTQQELGASSSGSVIPW